MNKKLIICSLLPLVYLFVRMFLSDHVPEEVAASLAILGIALMAGALKDGIDAD